jgi:hypothetical protein
MSRRRGIPALLLSALNLACSGPSPLEDSEARALGQLPPLLYSAAIDVRVEGGPEMPAEEKLALAHAIETALREDLGTIKAFAAIETGAGGDGSAGRRDPDIRIVATAVPAVEGGELPEAKMNMLRATFTGIVWVAAGIAGWLIHDTTFDPRWYVRLEIKHEGDAQPLEAPETLRPGPAELNFYQRSSWGQYLFQLICPPPLVPFNKAKTEESLDNLGVKDVSVQAALFAKRRLPGREVVGGRPFLFSRPGETEYIVFSPDVLVKFQVNGRDIKEIDPSLESAEAYLDETFGGLSRVEEDAAFQELKGYLEALSGLTAAPALPGAIEADLRRRFPRVYRLPLKTLETLVPPEDQVERVAVALDSSRDTFHRWTLRAERATGGD